MKDSWKNFFKIIIDKFQSFLKVSATRGKIVCLPISFQFTLQRERGGKIYIRKKGRNVRKTINIKTFSIGWAEKWRWGEREVCRNPWRAQNFFLLQIFRHQKISFSFFLGIFSHGLGIFSSLYSQRVLGRRNFHI